MSAEGEFKESDAEGIHVASEVDGFLIGGFGAEVVRRANELAFTGLKFGEAAGESEVGKFYGAGLGLKDVARFNVAVNDVELQGVPQGGGKLSGNADDFGKGQRAVGELMFERGAADQFHGKERKVAGLVHKVDVNDVGMVDARLGAGFLKELLDAGSMVCFRPRHRFLNHWG